MQEIKSHFKIFKEKTMCPDPVSFFLFPALAGLLFGMLFAYLMNNEYGYDKVSIYLLGCLGGPLLGVLLTGLFYTVMYGSCTLTLG